VASFTLPAVPWREVPSGRRSESPEASPQPTADLERTRQGSWLIFVRASTSWYRASVRRQLQPITHGHPHRESEAFRQ